MRLSRIGGGGSNEASVCMPRRGMPCRSLTDGGRCTRGHPEIDQHALQSEVGLIEGLHRERRAEDLMLHGGVRCIDVLDQGREAAHDMVRAVEVETILGVVLRHL